MTTRSIRRLLTSAGFAVAALVTVPAHAELSAEELAKLAQNPVGNLISLPFQNNTNLNFGPEKGTQNILNIQPVIPIEVDKDWNVITRTILPVISKPVARPERPRHQRHRRHGVHGVPVALRIPGNLSGVPGRSCSCRPTPTRSSATRTGGPGPRSSCCTSSKGDPWVYGVLANNIWSLTSNKQGGSYNNGLIQPFVNYNFKEGFYLTSSPILTVNWKADSGHKWTVPLGRRHRQDLPPRQAAGEHLRSTAYYNVVKPDNGPNWQIRAQSAADVSEMNRRVTALSHAGRQVIHRGRVVFAPEGKATGCRPAIPGSGCCSRPSRRRCCSRRYPSDSAFRWWCWRSCSESSSVRMDWDSCASTESWRRCSRTGWPRRCSWPAWSSIGGASAVARCRWPHAAGSCRCCWDSPRRESFTPCPRCRRR